jgi:gas vesicle protein
MSRCRRTSESQEQQKTTIKLWKKRKSAELARHFSDESEKGHNDVDVPCLYWQDW